VVVTDELILRGRSVGGGWTKAQLALLGVSWPPQKGWKSRVIGQQIADSAADEFINLKGLSDDRTQASE